MLAPMVEAMRSTNSRAELAVSLSGARDPALSGTVATTRAGVYPTPSKPRSPSDRTSNWTLSRSSPGTSCSSWRNAVHFASPTVSPVASTRTPLASSLIACVRLACA
jgi:hypothetical protein